jgi:hypothetical protein
MEAVLRAIAHGVTYGKLSTGLQALLVPDICEEIDRLRCERDSLRERLVLAQSEMRSLREELALARAGDRQAAPRQADPVYRSVGLDERCPEWVAVAVRRAYRSKLHPDRHPARVKSQAEERFKRAEQAFDMIWRRRGFKP